MIEPAFRKLLADHPDVKALAEGRVYFVAKPQNERRASVVLTLASSTHYHTMDGRAGYTTGRMQVDCFAEAYPLAKQLAKAARDALDDFAGTLDGTEIGYIELGAERDVPAAPLEGKATPQFGVSADARFLYMEP